MAIRPVGPGPVGTHWAHLTPVNSYFLHKEGQIQANDKWRGSRVPHKRQGIVEWAKRQKKRWFWLPGHGLATWLTWVYVPNSRRGYTADSVLIVYIHTVIWCKDLLFFLDLKELEGSEAGMIAKAIKAYLVKHGYWHKYLSMNFIGICSDGASILVRIKVNQFNQGLP